MTDFVFDELQVRDVIEYANNAAIFNYTRDRIDKEKVTLVSFDDEKLGSSTEKLDLAVCDKFGYWSILDIEDDIKGYNEIPLGYVTKGIDYKFLLVVIRAMSNMVLDKVRDSVKAYMYCKVEDFLSGIEDSIFQGTLAKDRICLNGTLEEVNERVKELDYIDYRYDLLEEIKRLNKENSSKMDRAMSDLELLTLDNIGKNVRFIRRDLLRVTLEVLSKNTGVSRDVICRLEALSDIEDSVKKGVKIVYPSISTVIKFCNGVGVTPSQLFETQVEFNDEIIDSVKNYCKDFMRV